MNLAYGLLAQAYSDSEAPKVGYGLLVDKTYAQWITSPTTHEPWHFDTYEEAMAEHALQGMSFVETTRSWAVVVAPFELTGLFELFELTMSAKDKP